MELSRSLLRSFARTINDDSRNKKVTNSMSGTVVMSGDRKFVKIDGSEALTPVFETVDIQEGDRVYVSIENHQASVIGNYSYPPSARVANQANAMAEQGILKVDGLIAVAITTENLTAHSATITNLVAQNINAGYAKITELDALKANIETLSGDVLNYKNATFEQLNAANGRIDNLSGDVLNYKNATFEQLEAAEGKITKLEGDVVSYKNATFEELEATKGQIDDLNGNFISYKEAVFEQLEAAEGKITNLEGDYLEYKQAVLNELQAQDAIITNISGDFASYKEVMAGELVAAKGWMLDGSIGNAQISNLDATKITSGIIDTSLITVKGSDGKLQIIDNTIQISDSNRVRVQIGKDSSNDYSMSVWDQNGLLIWDALGATENTIQRKIIRDKMVADDAAIQALKIDFQSFETALTNQGVTISGTVVQVGDKTLNVELSEQKQYIDDSIDNIEIGGRNIATGTNQGTVGWSWSMQVGGAIKETVIEDGINCCKLTRDNTEHSGWSFIFYKNIGRSKYKPNTVYTVSVEVKSNLVDVITFNGLTCTNATGKMMIDNFVRDRNISSTWTKVSWVVTTRDVLPEATDQGVYFTVLSANSVPGVWYMFRNLKIEEGNKATAWTPAPEDTQSQIDEHTETLSDHSTKISANEKAINLRVTSQEYESYKSTVNGELASHNSRLNSAESSIDILQDKISLKVEQTDITSSIDNLEIGGRNLVIGSSTADTSKWYHYGWNGTWTKYSDENRTYELKTSNGWRVAIYDMSDYIGEKLTISCDILLRSSSTNTENIIVSIVQRSDSTNTGTQTLNHKYTIDAADTWYHYEGTITLSEPYLGFYIRGINTDAGTGTSYVLFKNVKIEKGSKATDWTPAPEDIDSAISNVDAKFANYSTTTQMQAAIDISKNSILSSVSETYATKTAVDALETWKLEASQLITKDGIISTVGNYYAYTDDLNAATDRIAAAETTISQHAESIELRVEKAGVISAINQTSESITIDAAKINLTASGIINIINSGTTKIAASKINLSATDIVNIIGGSTVKIAAKNIDLSGYVTVTDLSTKGRTTIVGDNITSGTITGIAFKGVTGDFTGKITASELVTKVLMHDAVYGEIYFTSGTIHLSTRDHSNPLDPDAISYLSLSSYLTGSSELFSMSSLVLAGYDGVYIEAENEGTVAEFNHTQVEITPRLTALNGLYMGSPTQTGTERQITFVINSGTYPHHSYIYGGNSNSDFAIGVWDNKNSVSVWRYNDVYKTLEVNATFILKNGFEIYGIYPNIDFHHNNNSSSDYTSRIIEVTSGVLQVNGVKFSSSNITAARGSFYGTYTSTLGSRYGNQALEIRENGLVTNTQSDIGYAPAIGFHWAGRIAASLVFHNDGGFRFMNQAYTDFVPVFVSTLYLGGAPYGQIYCGTSYQLYINPRGSGAVYIGYDNRCIIPPSGGAAIRGNGDGTYDCGHTSYLWGTVYAKNGVKTTSDEREKDIMSLDLSELSDCFMSIKPIAFRWKYGSDKKIHLGVGAQTTERKMIEAGYDPSQFDMIQHDELEERSVSGLMERYGINYQDLNMLTMMQTQKTTREFTTFLKGFKEWKDTVDVDLSLFKDEQDELKEEVQNLKIDLALANQKIAELSAKTA